MKFFFNVYLQSNKICKIEVRCNDFYPFFIERLRSSFPADMGYRIEPVKEYSKVEKIEF